MRHGGELEEAMAFYQRDLELVETLAREQDTQEMKHDLFVSYLRIADVY